MGGDDPVGKSPGLASAIGGVGVILAAFTLVASAFRHLTVSIETGYPLFLASYSYQDVFPMLPSAFSSLAVTFIGLFFAAPAVSFLRGETSGVGLSSKDKYDPGNIKVQRLLCIVGLFSGVTFGFLFDQWLLSSGLMQVYGYVQDTSDDWFQRPVDEKSFFVVMLILYATALGIALFIFRKKYGRLDMARKGEGDPDQGRGDSGQGKAARLGLFIKMALRSFLGGLNSGLLLLGWILLLVLIQLLYQVFSCPGIGVVVVVFVLICLAAAVVVLLFRLIRYARREEVVLGIKKMNQLNSLLIIIFLFSAALFGVFCAAPNPLNSEAYYYVESVMGSRGAERADSGISEQNNDEAGDRGYSLILDTFANGKAVIREADNTFRLVSLEDGSILVEQAPSDGQPDDAECDE